MIDSQLAKIKEWFSIYISKFHNSNAEVNEAIEHKIYHTALVCDNAKIILKSLDWDPSDKFTAEAAALLHDIGRFQQISQYGTFLDSESVDHGVLGIEILYDENILAILSGRDQRLVIATVKWHNKYKLPDELPADEKAVVQLVRDADKLDLMKLFTEYYPQSQEQPNNIWEFSLKLGDDCSEQIVHDILANRMGNVNDVKNLNDLRIIKLSWLYDLNYNESKKIFKQNQYLEKTLAAVPATENTKKIAEHLGKYLEKI